MSLIRFDNVSLAFGERKIFSHAELTIAPKERVCVVGRNGAGKSTLLNLIDGSVQCDSGEITRINHLQLASLPQSLPETLDVSVRDVIGEGLANVLQLHQLVVQLAHDPVTNSRQIAALHAKLDMLDGWHPEKHIEKIITKLQLPSAKTMKELSGGLQRRVLLARALVGKPDMLLLDEPTNHLDLATVEWLEKMLLYFDGCLVFITHDRALANLLATRVIEIDRGKITSWPGNFANYLRRKEEANQDEDTANALFDKRLAQEETWIRQGIKARRTRNQGRVRALEEMRMLHQMRQKRPSRAQIHIHVGEPSGRKVIEARAIAANRGKNALFRHFSFTMQRKERIGIVGNNGVGKSTLLRMLLGEIVPDEGSVKVGSSVQVGYFDQSKSQLDPHKTVMENIADGSSYVRFQQKSKHVAGYLQSYLFDYKRLQSPLKILSGGEKSRVLLAKIFAKPYNLLALDEPTNDLDVELLEALEEALCQYQGSLLVISHDRLFLDAVTTRLIVFEEQALTVHEGGYSDFIAKGRVLASPAETAEHAKKPKSHAPKTKDAFKKTKVSYRQQREQEQLPIQIEKLEQTIANLENVIANNKHVDHKKQHEDYAKLAAYQHQLDTLMQRWCD